MFCVYVISVQLCCQAEGDRKENNPALVMSRKININLNPKNDFLYHLGFDTNSQNFQEMFGDVRVVCMGGSAHRMKAFAHYMIDILDHKLPVGTRLEDMTITAHRYSFFKIGPVVSVSHGMGMPSMSILLHELIKLVTYAKCKDPIFIRLGTSGGVGVAPGTVVITDKAYNEYLQNFHEFCILGKRVPRQAIFDEETINELICCKSNEDTFEIISGGTMGTNDFYEAQGRVDGAICDHTIEEKMAFLEKIQSQGIKNIEMEAPMFAALTKHCGIRAADVCVTIINRLEGDQVSMTSELKHEFEMRPQLVVGRFIKKLLSNESHLSE